MSAAKRLPDTAKQPLAVIFSVSGAALTPAERDFFAQANPLGFILFGRNCADPRQLRALTDSLRNCLGRVCPVLIDQEGGRVQRMKPPGWRAYPAPRFFGEAAALDMDKGLEDLRFSTLQMGEDLKDAGINVDCVPVADVAFPGMHDAIGDRTFSDDPEIVARLAECVCNNMIKMGITPVMKHIPGHGRARSDSHMELPVVDASLEEMGKTDFLPFRKLASSAAAPQIWGMVAHVLYKAIDPRRPSSASPDVIRLIREQIGFDGVLVSDDLHMKALDVYGSYEARVKAVLEAGCDIALPCNLDLPELEKIAASAPALSARSAERVHRSMNLQMVAA